MICASWDARLSDTLKFGFSFAMRDRQRSKIETVFGNSQNPRFVYDGFKLIWGRKLHCKTRKTEPFWPRYRHYIYISDTRVRLWILHSIFMFKRGGCEISFKANISGIKATNIITFLEHTWLKEISRNSNFNIVGEWSRSRSARSPWPSVFWCIEMKQQIKCEAYLWLYYCGSQDSVWRLETTFCGHMI